MSLEEINKEKEIEIRRNFTYHPQTYVLFTDTLPLFKISHFGISSFDFLSLSPFR
jgi:hypothetical protein